MKTDDFIAFAREAFPFLSAEQETQLRGLEALYRDWNAKINVISRKDIDELYLHHVLHSLAIAAYLQTRPEWLEAFRSGSILDLGTGGGFPGIPLAILFPEARFTLCDSVGKKLYVASAVAEGIGLQNVSFSYARAETLPGPFDFVVSRAVAALPDFYPWVKGRYRKAILYLKGGDVVEEIATLMGRFRLAKGSVSTWPVSARYDDPYFEGKFVIAIR